VNTAKGEKKKGKVESIRRKLMREKNRKKSNWPSILNYSGKQYGMS